MIPFIKDFGSIVTTIVSLFVTLIIGATVLKIKADSQEKDQQKITIIVNDLSKSINGIQLTLEKLAIQGHLAAQTLSAFDKKLEELNEHMNNLKISVAVLEQKMREKNSNA
jgi:hypothetical protein